jgi:competence protein ComFC
MELHRSERIIGVNGRLVEVQYLGVAAHEGLVRDAVLNLKYHGHRAVARQLALVIVDALEDLSMANGEWLVTWAPTSEMRRRKRGFDQSELIARHVGAFLGKPVRRLLRRTSSQFQTGHSRIDRLSAVSFQGRRIDSTAILLVDDVVTTGATFRKAAYELVRCGATKVICVAPSHTL